MFFRLTLTCPLPCECMWTCTHLHAEGSRDRVLSVLKAPVPEEVREACFDGVLFPLSAWFQHAFPPEQCRLENLWHWPDLDCSFCSPQAPLVMFLVLSLCQFLDKAVTDTSSEEGHSGSSAFLSMIKLTLWPCAWPRGPVAHQCENGTCSSWENKHNRPYVRGKPGWGPGDERDTRVSPCVGTQVGCDCDLGLSQTHGTRFTADRVMCLVLALQSLQLINDIILVFLLELIKYVGGYIGSCWGCWTAAYWTMKWMNLKAKYKTQTVGLIIQL